MSTPSQRFSNRKALLRMHSSSCLLFTVIIIAAAIWNNSLVHGAPAKLDALVETPFNSELQPPVFEASFSGGDGDKKKTLDSYGNPIESLKPIETPDGRKVVSAQGLQFEIPTYASGITELKKPSDDLLPPFVDPIAVAVPNDSSESSFTTVGRPATDVNVETAQLVEVNDATSDPFKALPEYIVELMDPDIGGPVEYMPTDDKKGLSILAWDLLPPLDAEPADISVPTKHRFNVASTNSHSISSAPSDGTGGRNSAEDQRQQHFKTSQTTASSFELNTESATKASRTQQSHRGNVHYTTSSTTPRSTTIKTTTTSRPTTTTTTTRRTTTLRTTTTKAPRTTSTTTTTPQPDSSEFFKLEAGDSYTLPPWLADIDDPDLDVAVAYVVPEDINEYNHTISRDLLPPLEPYTDLNAINVTPPPGFKDTKPTRLTTTTTPRTTTTRKTTSTTTTTPRSTTSTTRRSAVPSSQPHWVRAKVTSAPSARPTSPLSNQFTSSSQTYNSPTFTTASAGNSNIAQRTTTTSTTTVTPKTTLNQPNRPLSNTDKISSEESTSTDSQRQQNPFLNGSYKPQPFSKASTTTTRRTTTSTTTTTTTTPAPKVDVNPFEPTIPPWLRDFDYADVGPGVPFVYDPNDDESPVDEDILPPSKTTAALDAEATKASTTFVTSPTTATSFLNSQNQQSFSTKFSSTATSLTSASSIPSKVTLPLPSIELNQDDNSVAQPPMFVAPTPPAEDINTSKKTSSSFNTHFPARFEPSANPSATHNPTKVPLSADRESFPPFNTPSSSFGATIPTKTTFSKSEDGKVITNNIFLSGGATQTPPSKSFGTTAPANTQPKDNFSSPGSGFTKASTASNNVNQLTTSSGPSGFVTASSAASSGGTKYTGRFGGPDGVLAPNLKPAGFTTPSNPSEAQSINQSTTSAAATNAAANNANLAGKFTGSFGGPPGVLRPYDNVNSG